MGCSLCNCPTEQSRSLGAETTNRRDGRVAGGGQFDCRFETRVSDHIFRFRETDLSSIVRRIHPHGSQLRHAGLGRKRCVILKRNKFYCKDLICDYFCGSLFSIFRHRIFKNAILKYNIFYFTIWQSKTSQIDIGNV